MRILEILLTIFALVSLISGFIFKGERRHWRLFPSAVSVLLLIVHLVFEGGRWQMIPVYGVIVFLTLIFAITSLRKPGNEPKKGVRKILAVFFNILGLLIGSVAILATLEFATSFPVFKLPKPSGQYEVGRMNLVFEDCSREEIFTDDPDDCREVAAQVWYPAALNGNEKLSTYMHRDAARTFLQGLSAQGKSVPDFLLSYLSLVKTHSFQDAPLNHRSNPYPVLLFNPGYGAWPAGYTAFHEELASQGYVVVGITHAYECTWFVMPDGTIKTCPKTAEVALHHYEAFEKGEDIKWKITLSKEVEESERWYRALRENSPELYESVNIWAADTSFVIDQLERLNQQGELFDGALDLDRIGTFGHSFGGATSGQVSLLDPRVKAGVNMDGFQYGDLVDQPLTVPFMFINAEHASENRPDPDTKGIFNAFYERSESDVFILFVKGTEHNSFTDLVLAGDQFSDVRDDATDPERGLRITNDYLLAFFRKYLKGETTALLQEVSSPDYPEVVLHARSPQP